MTDSEPVTGQPITSSSIVFGLSIGDITVALLTRKVLIVAAAMFLLSVTATIVNVQSPRNKEGVSFFSLAAPIFLAALVPCCGYLGVKLRHPSILCFFCSISGLSVFIQIANIIILVLILTGGLDGSDITSTTPEFIIATLCIDTIALFLNAMAFWWSNKLYHSPYWRSSVSIRPAENSLFVQVHPQPITTVVPPPSVEMISVPGAEPQRVFVGRPVQVACSP